jgi:hypothetical protein
LPESFLFIDPPLGTGCFDEIVKQIKEIPNTEVYQVIATDKNLKANNVPGYDYELIVKINSQEILGEIRKILNKYSGVKRLEQLMVKV